MTQGGADHASSATPPWWAHPVTGLAIFALPGALLAFATPADQFARRWGAPKYVDLSDLSRAFLAVGAFAVGSLWWRFAQREAPAGPVASLDDERVLAAFRFLSRVAFFSYGLWALVGLRRGVTLGQVQAAVTGEAGAVFVLKRLMAPIGGVTTFTQTALIAAALAGLLIRRGKSRLVLGPLVALSVLALLRAYFLSERLAILEVGLPLVLGWLLAPTEGVRLGPPHRLGPALFPLIYVAVAAALFAAFEYNRSWAYYRTVSTESYATFARDRFLGYYTTSTNNAALVLHDRAGPRLVPFTIQWLEQLPGLDLVVDLYGDRISFDDLLAGAGVADFNTEGALNAPAIDWGPQTSLLIWFAGGAAFTLLFDRVRRGDAAFLPLYATAYVGIVESGRYFYWGTGRAVVPLVTGVLVVRFLKAGHDDEVDSVVAPCRSAPALSVSGPIR